MKYLLKNTIFFCFIGILFSCNDTNETPSIPGKTYNIGDYYQQGHVRGIVASLEEGNQHGIILSLEETVCQWDNRWAGPHRGTNPSSDSWDNLKLIQQIPGWDTIHPAFSWCASLPNDKNDTLEWTIPSVNLWSDIVNEICGTEGLFGFKREPFTIFNNRIKEYGGTPLSTERNAYYWSSCEVSAHVIWCVGFSERIEIIGHLDGADLNKFFNHRTRAVRKF